MRVTEERAATPPQQVRCEGCGLANRVAARFCAGCGRAIASTRAELEPDPPATVGGTPLPPPPAPDQGQGLASSATAPPPPPPPGAPPATGPVEVGLPPPPPPGGLPPPPAAPPTTDASPAADAPPAVAPDAGEVTTPAGAGSEAPPASSEHEPPRTETAAAVRRPRWRPGAGPRPLRKRYVYASILLGVVLLVVAVIVLFPRPRFVATSFTMPEVALSGEDVTVSLQLANEGRAAGEHTLTVLVDGQPAQSVTTSLEAGGDEVVEVVIADLAPGTHELVLADGDGLGGVVWVLTAPVFELPEAVISGEDVVVDVLVSNEGPAPVSQELTLVAEDQARTVTGDPQAASLELAGGAEQSVRFVFPALDAGDYELTATIGDWEGPAGDVWVMTPARFEVDGLDVQPDPMDINDSQEATVTTSITNVGEADGTYQLRLELDGELVEERSIDLRGGSSTEEAFPVTITEAGPHELVAGGRTVSFEAYQLERPANGTVLTNQIGGGRNELRITNNFDEDYLVVLARPGEGNPALLSVYVRGGTSHTVYGVRDGTYSTYYAYGTAWCTHHQTFTQGAGHGRYEDDDTFTSSSTSYTWVALTFGITDGPGSPTDWVSADDFPTM
jgi:hypothetical protein